MASEDHAPVSPLASSPLKEIDLPKVRVSTVCPVPARLDRCATTAVAAVAAAAGAALSSFKAVVLPTAPALPLHLQPTAPLSTMMFLTLGLCFEVDGYE